MVKLQKFIEHGDLDENCSSSDMLFVMDLTGRGNLGCIRLSIRAIALI
jgi:hypothetical protein